MNIMLDLETLSSSPDACIVAIGAATFSSDGADQDKGFTPRQKFYAVVDPQSAQDAGGVITARTVQWWAKQSDAARAVLNDSSAIDIYNAVRRFAGFCLNFAEPKIWGNGAGFDNVVLRQAFERLGLKGPWEFRNDHCYRTLKNLRPDIAFEPYGVAHHALDDAIAQARHAERILAALNRQSTKQESRT